MDLDTFVVINFGVKCKYCEERPDVTNYKCPGVFEKYVSDFWDKNNEIIYSNHDYVANY